MATGVSGRQIVHDHSGVVGRMEAGVGRGQFVRLVDGVEAECLRGLRTEGVRPVGHGTHHLAVAEIFGQQHGVSGGEGHGGRLESVKRVDAAVDG